MKKSVEPPSTVGYATCPAFAILRRVTWSQRIEKQSELLDINSSFTYSHWFEFFTSPKGVLSVEETFEVLGFAWVCLDLLGFAWGCFSVWSKGTRLITALIISSVKRRVCLCLQVLIYYCFGGKPIFEKKSDCLSVVDDLAYTETTVLSVAAKFSFVEHSPPSASRSDLYPSWVRVFTTFAATFANLTNLIESSCRTGGWVCSFSWIERWLWHLI